MSRDTKWGSTDAWHGMISTSSSRESVVHVVTTERVNLSSMSGGCFGCCPCFWRSPAKRRIASKRGLSGSSLDNTSDLSASLRVVHEWCLLCMQNLSKQDY